MKQSSCSMHLTNKTEHYVAFKVICCNTHRFMFHDVLFAHLG
jgi:hypothetical protein